MKKALSSVTSALMLCVALTGCITINDNEPSDPDLSDSDPDLDPGNPENFGTPKYKGDAALYVFDEAVDGYTSLELTESGNYILTGSYDYDDDYDYDNDYYASPVAARTGSLTAGIFSRTAPKARYFSPKVIWGSYTKNADGSYTLKNFWTIFVASNGSVKIICPENGSEITVQANKKTQYPDSDLTNALCRTWTVVSFEYWAYGKRYYFTGPDHPGLYEVADMWLDKVIFTKAGTYFTSSIPIPGVDYWYPDEFLPQLNTWEWENQSEGIVRTYAGYINNDNMYYGSSNFNVYFGEDNTLEIFYEFTPSESATFTLIEADN